MPDPLGAAVQGVGDRGGAVGLPGVDGHPQPLGAGALELGAEPGGGEALLGAGEVQAHHAAVAPGEGDLDQIVGGVEVAQVAQQLADDDPPPGRLRRGDPLVEPVLHGLHGLVEREPAVGVLMRGPAGLGVDHAVGHHVLHELAGHAPQLRGRLHHGDRALEGGEIGGQRAGIGGAVEPVGDRPRRVGRGSVGGGLGRRGIGRGGVGRDVAGRGAAGGILGVRSLVEGGFEARHLESELLAQFEHGLGAQPAVEVIVEGDLRQGADEGGGEIHSPRIRVTDGKYGQIGHRSEGVGS